MNPLKYILCIDDDPMNQEIVTDYLQDDYEIICMNNGAEGLNSIQARYPDLILLDIMMPIVNGKEVIQHLKNSEQFAHIPVIIISALSYQKDINEFYQLGAEAYITKPFKGEELIQIIDKLINN